jgi:hypothetical protein
LQRIKKDAEEIGLAIRSDEAGRLKWEAYKKLPFDPKFATIAIWADKVMFGLREQSGGGPLQPSVVQGVRFVAAVPPSEAAQ